MLLQRGQWLTFYDVPDARRLVREVPGIEFAGGGVATTEDAATALSVRYIPEEDTPPEPKVEGLRDYQRQGTRFLTGRGYAMLCLPMQTGKTLTTLAAIDAIGARRTLVICPAGARLVWADESLKWLSERVLLLYGRGAAKARYRGDRWYLTREGTSRAEAEQFERAMSEARIVVVNYDLLLGHRESDEAGVLSNREELPGWAKLLGSIAWDVAVLDECDQFAGWKAKDRHPRWRYVAEATRRAVRCWGLTGTPTDGRPADFWTQLTVLSGGLYGGWSSKLRGYDPGLPFKWHARYCDGHKGTYGWVFNGATNVAELTKRLDLIKWQPSREELLPDMPPKQRQIIRIENDASLIGGIDGVSAATASKLLSRTYSLKEPVLVEQLLPRLKSGERVIVLTQRQATCEKAFKRLVKLGTSREHGSKLKERGYTVWRAMGGDALDKIAEAFRGHDGAGVLVGTIDAWCGYRSLFGASSVHYIEYSFRPKQMLQSEDRAYRLGTRGLSIVYYQVEKSIDEHALSVLVPKIEQLAELGDAKNAESLLTTFAKESETQLLDDVFRSMMGG